MKKRETTRLPPATTIDGSVSIVDYTTYHKGWYGGPGNHEHDLLCSDPNCPHVLLIGWTFEEAKKTFSNRTPAIGKCPDGHFSVLPMNIVDASPYPGFDKR